MSIGGLGGFSLPENREKWEELARQWRELEAVDWDGKFYVWFTVNRYLTKYPDVLIWSYVGDDIHKERAADGEGEGKPDDFWLAADRTTERARRMFVATWRSRLPVISKRGSYPSLGQLGSVSRLPADAVRVVHPLEKEEGNGNG
jgi:hypothetical protein